MKISDNFDRWMFDYKEGNLSPAEMQEFENFLLQHPEFEVDADAWDLAYIPAESVIYPDSKKLEKKRRVAAYYWSAAAFLLLLIGSGSLIYFNPNGASLDQAIQRHASSHDLLVTLTPETTTDLSIRAGKMFAALSSETRLSNNLYAHNLPGTVTNYSSAVNNENGVGQTEPGFGSNQYYAGSGSAQGAVHLDLMDDEVSKVAGGQHNAKYENNPGQKNMPFDVKGKVGNNSSQSHNLLRKISRRIDRMLGYPVGLTNLKDQQLNIPQMNILSFNPGFTGGMLKPRFEMLYRNQWLGTSQASQELTIAYDNYSYGLRGGVGFMLNAQDYGMGKFGDYNVSVFYSPKLVLSKNVVFEPAVKLSLGTLVANGNKLPASSGIEMDRGRVLETIGADQMIGVTQQWYKDFGLGAVLNTKWFYAGFSADNLSRHYENVYGNDLSSPAKSPVKLSAVIGTDYNSRSKTMTFSPYIVYRQCGSSPELWGGMNYHAGWFTVGGSISSKQEFSASAGIKLEGFRLIYQYDYTESVLTQNRMGSHNIGVRFNAKRKNQRLTH